MEGISTEVVVAVIGAFVSLITLMVTVAGWWYVAQKNKEIVLLQQEFETRIATKNRVASRRIEELLNFLSWIEIVNKETGELVSHATVRYDFNANIPDSYQNRYKELLYNQKWLLEFGTFHSRALVFWDQIPPITNVRLSEDMRSLLQACSNIHDIVADNYRNEQGAEVLKDFRNHPECAKALSLFSGIQFAVLEKIRELENQQ